MGLGALVAILAGCGAPSSRTFAVTLTETGGVACVGQAVGLLADPVALEEAADELRREWKSAYESAVVRPEPRTLHVNELETRVQAWFELGADGCPPWAIAPEPINPGTPVDPYEQDASDSSSDLPAGDGICSAAAFAYDDSITVYEGEPQSDYVETSYVDAINTDEADEAAELYPCGPRPVAQGVLSFTDQAGASGRVRWTHTHWIASEYSACEGRIDCVRNVALEGLEVE